MKPTAAQTIAKEELGRLRFPQEAVSLNETHRTELSRKLARAVRLGNGEHGKCRILFRDAEGLKVVETTIWSADDRSIVLKSGATIPLARVIDIEMPL
ncbi:MAG: hypothetical protein IT228_05015 [Flavobacteriales bacterium]|nr:hypothetical protein [Flavobacteriales bacterium]MCC6576685.1 hypothetical protein [Flavobacteriales bacterium]NUQ15194.1 hypothetical protein [Flavobacteriales bacterium]